ncbi:MAG: surface-adhesin E family protein [Gemmatimonadaceae bacterium]
MRLLPTAPLARAASACALVALLSAPAAAQRKAPATAPGKSSSGRWRMIGKTSSGNPVFVDPKSVSTANGITTATVRVQFLEPVDTPKGKYTSARTVAMFDCARRVVAVKENTYYLDEQRNRIAEHKVVGLPGYGTVIKGALPDVAMQHLCAR